MHGSVVSSWIAEGQERGARELCKPTILLGIARHCSALLGIAGHCSAVVALQDLPVQGDVCLLSRAPQNARICYALLGKCRSAGCRVRLSYQHVKRVDCVNFGGSEDMIRFHAAYARMPCTTFPCTSVNR